MDVWSSTPLLDPLTRAGFDHASHSIFRKITAGLSRDLGRLPARLGPVTLRAANHPETTRYNYLLAAAQLGRYLAPSTRPTRTPTTPPTTRAR